MKISIIVPVYKVPLEFLRECFDSLVAQTLQDCEIIVISDGAPDAECSVCEEYAVKDSRFKFFKRDHAGVSAARNFGIEQARGEYITFVDADDWIQPETCESTYTFAKQNNSDLVFCDLLFFEGEISTQRTAFSNQNLPLLTNSDIDIYKRSIIHVPSRHLLIPAITVCKLYRLQIIKAKGINYETELHYGEDRVFNYQFIQASKNISYYNQALYHYRIHNLSATKKFQKEYISNALKYIAALEKVSKDTYKAELGNEFFEAYTISWAQCYMHPQNTDSFTKRMQQITEGLSTDSSQKYLSYATYSRLSIVSILELFCLKHDINAIIWIHGLLKYLSNKASPFQSK